MRWKTTLRNGTYITIGTLSMLYFLSHIDMQEHARIPTERSNEQLYRLWGIAAPPSYKTNTFTPEEREELLRNQGLP